MLRNHDVLMGVWGAGYRPRYIFYRGRCGVVLLDIGVVLLRHSHNNNNKEETTEIATLADMI